MEALLISVLCAIMLMIWDCIWQSISFRIFPSLTDLDNVSACMMISDIYSVLMVTSIFISIFNNHLFRDARLSFMREIDLHFFPFSFELHFVTFLLNKIEIDFPFLFRFGFRYVLQQTCEIYVSYPPNARYPKVVMPVVCMCAFSTFHSS